MLDNEAAAHLSPRDAGPGMYMSARQSPLTDDGVAREGQLHVEGAVEVGVVADGDPLLGAHGSEPGRELRRVLEQVCPRHLEANGKHKSKQEEGKTNGKPRKEETKK